MRLLAYLPEMRLLFAHGYTLKEIHQYLVEDCNFELSERAFASWRASQQIRFAGEGLKAEEGAGAPLQVKSRRASSAADTTTPVTVESAQPKIPSVVEPPTAPKAGETTAPTRAATMAAILEKHRRPTPEENAMEVDARIRGGPEN